MLAITANWAIADGTLADSRVGRAAGWLEAIRRAVVRAGCGRDGRYRPVTEVTLVFAGDTFEWLLSDAWADGDRPWHGDARGREVRSRIALATARAARPLLGTIVRWTRQGLPVPEATGRGRPSEWAVTRARLRPVLLAGDRDAWLVDHAAWASQLGISIGDAWSDDQLHVRHGHDLDPLAHRAGGPRLPTLGESLVIDLVVRFAVSVRGAATLWPLVRPRLAALAAARPAEWPACIARIAAASQPRAIESLWRRAVASWHAAAIREIPSCETEFDALAALRGWLERPALDGVVPAAIRRLDAAAVPGRSGRTAVVADPPGGGSPSLACHVAGEPAWVEHLGTAPPSTPAVVAIGADACGSSVVDAA